MIRTLRRGWRYFAAWLNGRLDQLMDPRIQIEQALEEAKRRHAALSEQAAAVIGNERELEARIFRAKEESARLRDAAGRTLVLADRARKNGDAAKAAGYEGSARSFVGRLSSLESSTAVLTGLVEKARLASAGARQAVEQNATALRQQVTQRAELLTELEAAKLQERMAEAIGQLSDYGPSDDVPTLGNVRERIDVRFARATGRAELAAESVDARLIDAHRAEMEFESEQRLEEIRRSLGLSSATPMEADQKN